MKDVKIEVKAICPRVMLEFGFAASTDLERVEKRQVGVEVEASLLNGGEVPFVEHNSDEGRVRSVIIRKEGMRKEQNPTLEGVIRRAPWILLDPTEELLDPPQMKPCHHSTPLLSTSSGISMHQPC